MQDLQPLSQLRCRHYQGTPAYASADLQPLSHLTVPAPLTQGSLCGECKLTPSVQLRRRHYQGTPTYASADLQPLSQLALTAPLTQGSLCGECKLTPSVSYADGTTKARLRMPQALLRCPYTGEPIEVGADRHRQKNLPLDK